MNVDHSLLEAIAIIQKVRFKHEPQGHLPALSEEEISDICQAIVYTANINADVDLAGAILGRLSVTEVEEIEFQRHFNESNRTPKEVNIALKELGHIHSTLSKLTELLSSKSGRELSEHIETMYQLSAIIRRGSTKPITFVELVHGALQRVNLLQNTIGNTSKDDTSPSTDDGSSSRGAPKNEKFDNAIFVLSQDFVSWTDFQDDHMALPHSEGSHFVMFLHYCFLPFLGATTTTPKALSRRWLSLKKPTDSEKPKKNNASHKTQ